MTTQTDVKINLGLNVLRRRPDGYHDLETLFVPYRGIGDVLEMEPADELSIVISKAGGVDWDPMQDLTVRAWRLLKADFDIPAVRIRLEKHAPVGAGLGGGSADAAFALRMMNGMFSLGLEDAVLASYAARLGSDCAFFIYDRPMLGTGRGEVLTPYALDLSGYEIRVTVPEDVAVSTAEAYRGVRFHEGPSLAEALARPVEEWKDVLVNDFESTVFAAHPKLASIKSSLYRDGAVYASMSGSGSALFGIYKK